MKFRPRHSFSPLRYLFVVVFFRLFVFLIYISMILVRHERKFLTLWSLVRVEFPPFISLHSMKFIAQFNFCRILYFLLSKSWSHPTVEKKCVCRGDSVRFFILWEFVVVVQNPIWNGQNCSYCLPIASTQETCLVMWWTPPFSDLFYQ